MKPIRLAVLATLALGLAPVAAWADFLVDNTMQQGLADWKGDGDVAYLNADGTEGAQGDAGVTQVIKIPLSKSHARYIYQDFKVSENLAHLSASVEVMASPDFKRSKFPNDYSSDIHWGPGSLWYWSDTVTPNVDFWIRIAPVYDYKLANLKPGQWVTVKATWDAGPSATDRSICFFVPPGDGAIYIRKANADGK